MWQSGCHFPLGNFTWSRHCLKLQKWTGNHKEWKLNINYEIAHSSSLFGRRKPGLSYSSRINFTNQRKSNNLYFFVNGNESGHPLLFCSIDLWRSIVAPVTRYIKTSNLERNVLWHSGEHTQLYILPGCQLGYNLPLMVRLDLTSSTASSWTVAQ